MSWGLLRGPSGAAARCATAGSATPDPEAQGLANVVALSDGAFSQMDARGEEIPVKCHLSWVGADLASWGNGITLEVVASRLQAGREASEVWWQKTVGFFWGDVLMGTWSVWQRRGYHLMSLSRSPKGERDRRPGSLKSTWL